VLALEFPRHFTGPVFFRRQRGGASERAHQRDDDLAHLMPHEPNKERREDRRAEDDSERGLRQIAARRLVRKLPRDEFEIAFDQSEVGSRLIDRPQLYDVFVWHSMRPSGSWKYDRRE
jgi:hypothetical protein